MSSAGVEKPMIERMNPKMVTGLNQWSNLCPGNGGFWCCRETARLRFSPRRSLLDADQWLQASWCYTQSYLPQGSDILMYAAFVFKANPLITLDMQQNPKIVWKRNKNKKVQKPETEPLFCPPSSFSANVKCRFWRNVFNPLHPSNHSWYEHKTFLNKLSWDSSQPVLFGLPTSTKQ